MDDLCCIILYGILYIRNTYILWCSQRSDVENPMHVRDRADLDRRAGVELAHGVRPTDGVRVVRLAVLHERQPVAERDVRLQSASGHRPVRDTAVDHDVGVLGHRVRAVGLVGTRKRPVAERPEPDAEQKAGKSAADRRAIIVAPRAFRVARPTTWRAVTPYCTLLRFILRCFGRVCRHITIIT